MTSGKAPPPPTLARRKLLLIISSVVFSLWIAALLAMYFTTVYPQRHPGIKSQTTSKPLPG